MKFVHIEGKEHLESTLRKGKGGHCLSVELINGSFEQASPRSKPDSDVGESPDLCLLPKDRKKDGAGEEGRTPDLMLGKHGRRKKA
jgi:hypothetical protein